MIGDLEILPGIRQLGRLFRDMPHIAIHGCDGGGVVRYWNRTAERLYGFTAAEALGAQRESLLLPPHLHEAAHRERQLVLASGEPADPGYRVRSRSGGDIIEIWSSQLVVVAEDGSPEVFYIDLDPNVSGPTQALAAQAVQEQLHSLAFYDPLTRLPNRRLLLDRLTHALALAARTPSMGAIMFLDLDNFKTLNDTQGHDIGDLLLVEVARRLQMAVRQTDTVARLGGDEFVVMLEDLDNGGMAAPQAEAVAVKILKALHQPYRLERAGDKGKPLTVDHHCTASIGIALFGSDNEGIDDLLKRADLAMYQSKDAGRNTIRFFDSAMQAIVTERASMEADLRQAIDNGQLSLYYQPQTERDGRVIGVEALLRWDHPLRGRIPPGEFIPLAEDTGLILPIGQWVLESACRQLATWAYRPGFAQLTIAVNISARQIYHPDFVAQVIDTLDRTGANPVRLKLELTESVLVRDVEQVIARMKALRAIGVGYSLDDFGTGYSSLAYLKRLPLDQLKIDQSFVQDLLTNANDAAIARMIIALAQSLGLSVVAEGVETTGQQDYLSQIGCHAYQGYLGGFPMPLDELERELAQRLL